MYKHKTVAVFLLSAGVLPAATWTMIGWSDFGVNPMERDYSVFAIYPPYGTVHAQLIDSTGVLYKGASAVTVTYEAAAAPNAGVNSSSSGKTNFWQFAQVLFGGSTVADKGVSGNSMPGSGNVPQPMKFDTAYNRFTAAGIPVTPYDDSLNLNYYPVFKLTARDSSGTVLATTTITLPVSNEVECRGCHASGVNTAAQPLGGYANDSNPNRDFKLNILQLHDEKNRRNPTYQSALATLNYSSAGLVATATGDTPVSCTGCHLSNQFGSPGMSSIESLTGAMHINHSSNIDPATGDTLDNGTTRATCYNCHPGTHTQALRGAMARSVDSSGNLQIQCQSCHGAMSAVGDPSRNGWVDLPNCQACHVGTAMTAPNGNTRLTTALTSTGALNQPADTTFATTPNQPTAGASLYRFSSGHGNLQCAACHGSTHVESPSSQPNDNLQAIALAGRAAPLQDCTICHQTGISSTNGGPHGMHDVGAGWVDSHTRTARNVATCQPCHGADLKGTVLSRAFTTRVITLGRNASVTMFRGYQVGCYTCHNGPGGNGNAPTSAVVGNANATAVSGQATTIPVGVTNGGVLRIVTKPTGGTAYISGNTIVYTPQSNFEGADQITYAALVSAGPDSNLGTTTIQVKSAVRPAFASGGVANAASYAPGIAPGMIAYVYGSGMGPSNMSSYELNSGGFIEKGAASTRVLFNGIPAPVLYTSDSQLSAIVPYGLSGANANMVVEYNGIQSAAVSLPMTAVLPGIFTANASGKGQAAVFNQDGSANSTTNPAAPGSVVTIYVTGEGATNPAGVDGKLAVAPFTVAAQPVTVLIGGQAAQVQYAGGAPGEVAGIMQINAAIPSGIPSGTTAVVVSVGGAPSASGVTIEVK
ncbi:MAG TPA: Ig-like domain-containing protein [Bryobacteraceae bacterium]|jgi:uncharacterized protein (TIGR03437 family)